MAKNKAKDAAAELDQAIAGDAPPANDALPETVSAGQAAAVLAKTQKPTIGRIVHFRTQIKENDREKIVVLPAIVFEVRDDGLVNLSAFGRNGVTTKLGVPHSETGEDLNVWFWPPRS